MTGRERGEGEGGRSGPKSPARLRLEGRRGRAGGAVGVTAREKGQRRRITAQACHGYIRRGRQVLSRTWSAGAV